jgi:molybdenum cofactor guanylyltransferase
MQTAGFVLVGGKSRRMGRDKALLPFGSGVLAQHVASVIASVVDEVTLIGDPGLYLHLGFPCLPDRRSGFGPLSGIEAALESGKAKFNLVLACDLPVINADHLRLLLHTACSSDAQCILMEDNEGRLQPLCAVYRSDCLPAVRRAIDEKNLKLMDLVRALDAQVVPLATRLWNVNTIEEWEAVRAIDGH